MLHDAKRLENFEQVCNAREKQIVEKDVIISSLRSDIGEIEEAAEERVRAAVKNANKLVASESEKIKSLLASKTVAFQFQFEQLHERLRINKESNDQLAATCERLPNSVRASCRPRKRGKKRTSKDES